MCKQHDREAMGALVESFQQQIYRLCYRFLRNEEDSLDCTQETFLKAISAFDSFQEGKPLSPWLRRIAANTCLNHIRQRSRTTSLEGDEDEYGNWEERTPAPEDVPEEAEARLMQAWVDEQMKDLPPTYRMALVLRHVEDMSYQDIADQMGVPIGTVKTYLFRGRNILKSKLAEYMRQEVAVR
ncbi:MAG: RNA polymerase sigma factor [Chloroflexota bacterium]